MNVYLLQLMTKWITTICMMVIGLFNSDQYFTENKIQVNNMNQLKNSTVIIEKINYKTVSKKDSSIPSNLKTIKQKGKNGIKYTIGNKETVIKKTINEVVQVGTGAQGEYTGKMTGYGADCTGCSGTGNLACKTKEGRSFSLIKDGKYYNDDEYGKVRILAAALEKFPCGTIIRVSNTKLNAFTAIVLDTGGAMRNAWSNGIVHMDLAFISQKTENTAIATDSNVKYSVQRWGW